TRVAKKDSAAKPAKARAKPAEPSPAAAETRKTKAAVAKTVAGKPAAKKETGKATSGGKGMKSAGKPWLKSYPEGIPAEIGPIEYQSLGDLLVESCRGFAGRPSFT